MDVEGICFPEICGYRCIGLLALREWCRRAFNLPPPSRDGEAEKNADIEAAKRYPAKRGRLEE
jgi:hypothetical protein